MDLAGGTEDVNKRTVMGALYDENAQPAAGVAVALIPAEYDPTGAEALPDSLKDTTDAQGAYVLNAPGQGVYNIEAVAISARTRALITGITVDSDTTEVISGTLRPGGSLDVTLPERAGSRGGHVYVPGTTIKYQTPGRPFSNVMLDSLPAAVLPVMYYTEPGTRIRDTLRYAIAIASGDTAVLWKPGWKYSRRLRLSVDPSLSSVSIRYPLLVRLTEQKFSFDQADPYGNDIRFTRHDNFPLSYEIERWDVVDGKAEIWVSMDAAALRDTAAIVFMYWGKSGIFSESNGATVFDTGYGYKGVWHCNENPAAGANAIKDRTANGFHGTPGGDMDAGAIVDAAIGKGLLFDGINDHVKIGDVDLAGTYTLSAWVYADSLGTPNRFIWKQNAYTLWYDIGGPGGIRCEHHSGSEWRGIAQDSGFAPPMNAGSWYFLCGTYDGDKVRIYVNGELQSETRSIGVNPQDNADELFFSRINEYVHGTMDEIRIETVARPAGWIRLRYETEKPGSEAIKNAE